MAYKKPTIALVGGNGKPAHLGAIIRFNVAESDIIAGKKVKELIDQYMKK